MTILKEQIDKELYEMKASPCILEHAKHVSSMEHTQTQGSRKKRKRVMAAVACLTAVTVLTAITAAANGAFGYFSNYFTGDLQPYHDQIIASALQGENQDFAVGIDGVLYDGQQCMFVMNLEALSSQGTKDLKTMGEKHQNLLYDKITLRAYLSDGTERALSGLSHFSYGDLQSSSFRSYVMEINSQDVGLESLEKIEKLYLQFDDIELEIPMNSPLQSFSLTAEANAPQEGSSPSNAALGKGSAGTIRDVTLSPIGFCYKGYGDDFSAVLIRKDGTPAEKDKSYDSGYMRENDTDEVKVFGNFRYEILDLNEYLGLRINGVNYYLSETSKS